MEARQKSDRYKQKVEEAYLLWEADSKPQGKWEHYCQLAEGKLIEEDRIIAEEKLEKKQLPIIYKPYYFLEKKILEPADEWISRQAFFTILGRLGNIAVLAALLSFVFGENYRRNDEIFAAWTTITTAGDQPGSGGRIEALEFLNSRPLKFPWIGWTKKGIYWDEGKQKCEIKRLWGRRWDKQSLTGLFAPNSNLAKIHLCSPVLGKANLQDSYLWEANLFAANLIEANLLNAVLGKANLQFSSFLKANLQDALLSEANLQNTIFKQANLQNTNLLRAELQNTTLLEANLIEANLIEANLLNADLKRANLQDAYLGEANLLNVNFWGANLLNTNFWGAINLTPRQVKSACNWKKAKFSEEFMEELEREPDQKVDCSRWD